MANLYGHVPLNAYIIIYFNFPNKIKILVKKEYNFNLSFEKKVTIYY